jgi:hypothetical protein
MSRAEKAEITHRCLVVTRIFCRARVRLGLRVAIPPVPRASGAVTPAVTGGPRAVTSTATRGLRALAPPVVRWLRAIAAPAPVTPRRRHVLLLLLLLLLLFFFLQRLGLRQEGLAQEGGEVAGRVEARSLLAVISHHAWEVNIPASHESVSHVQLQSARLRGRANR